MVLWRLNVIERQARTSPMNDAHSIYLIVNRDREPSSEAIFVTGTPGAKFVVTDWHPAS